MGAADPSDSGAGWPLGWLFVALHDEPAPDSRFLEGNLRTGPQWVLREACAAAHEDGHCHGDGLGTQR